MSSSIQAINPLASFPKANQLVLDHINNRILNDSSSDIGHARRESEGVLISGPNQAELNSYVNWVASQLTLPIYEFNQESVLDNDTNLLLAHDDKELSISEVVSLLQASAPCLLYLNGAEQLLPPREIDKHIYRMKPTTNKTINLDDEKLSAGFRGLINGIGTSKVALFASTNMPKYVNHSSIEDDGSSSEANYNLHSHYVSSGGTRIGRINHSVYSFHKLHEESVFSKRKKVINSALIIGLSIEDKKISGTVDLEELELKSTNLSDREVMQILQRVENLTQENIIAAFEGAKS
jgi:hypothetical protein